MHFVDPLSCLLGLSLFKPSVDGETPLGVAEVLSMKDLKFPILLDKSEDGDRIEVESVPAGGREYTRGLSWSRIMILDDVMVLHRGTNLDDNFPRRFNHFLISDLGVVGVSLRT